MPGLPVASSAVQPDHDLAELPLRVGLVGAGPWARLMHGPMLRQHPGTALSGIWARRPGAAAALARDLGTDAFDDLDALFDRSDAIAFCVPPDVQVELGIRAARAGKALLLEKPLALVVDGAERLAGAIAAAGVGSQLVLTWRYAPPVRALLAEAAGSRAMGGRGQFVNGAMRGGPFATPWRLAHGPLFDLGPHVIDALDAALGPVLDVSSHGRFDGWVGLLLEHEGGACSEVSLSCSVALPNGRAELEIYGEDRRLHVDASAIFADPALAAATTSTIVDEFVVTARTGAHPLDAAHGLRLQRILARALARD